MVTVREWCEYLDIEEEARAYGTAGMMARVFGGIGGGGGVGGTAGGSPTRVIRDPAEASRFLRSIAKGA